MANNEPAMKTFVSPRQPRTDQGYELKQFNNIGVLETRLPLNLFENLKNTINSTQEDTFNKNLLGHMNEEYSLNQYKDSSGSDLQDYILGVASEWMQHNEPYVGGFEEVSKCEKYGIYLDSLWVNKQKKYEFNPLHHHAGVLSFVIWVQIPYNLAEEEAVFPEVSGQEHNCHTSKFVFYYTDILGKIINCIIPVDKSYESTMLVFPAALQHAVYPFYTSDDYRISVSGNVRIKDLDNMEGS